MKISDQAKQNSIGFSSNPAGKNIIGGNGYAGVGIIGGANNNIVIGNAIGAVDVDNPIPNLIANNTTDGVSIDNASSNTVRDANVIAFNERNGVWLQNGAKDNVIRNQSIYNNSWHGVALSGAGTTGNQINEVNLYNNAGDGISESDGASFNTWSEASAFDNGGLGIDKEAGTVSSNIVTPPYPTVSSAYLVGPNLYVIGGLASASSSAGASNKVDVFIMRLDPSGFGEGAAYLGSANVDMATGKWTTFFVWPFPSVPTLCATAYQTFKPDAGTPASSFEFGPSSCRMLAPMMMR